MAVGEMSVAPSRFSWPWAFAALATWLVLALCHLKFSIWLVTPRDTPFGKLPLSTWVPHVTLAAVVALAICLVFQLRRSHRPWWTAGFWGLFAVAVAAQDRFLTFSFNEYAHYPQYGLVAWLVARAVDPRKEHWPVVRILFWTTLLGAVDEVMQYLWITASYSDYVDFNDFLVNLVSAMGGVLIYYGGARPPVATVQGGARPEWIATIMVTVGIALGFASGYLVHTPQGKIPNGGIARSADGRSALYLQRGPAFFGVRQPGPRHGQYYVLRPLEGLGLMVAAGAAFAAFRPRWRA